MEKILGRIELQKKNINFFVDVINEQSDIRLRMDTIQDGIVEANKDMTQSQYQSLEQSFNGYINQLSVARNYSIDLKVFFENSKGAISTTRSEMIQRNIEAYQDLTIQSKDRFFAMVEKVKLPDEDDAIVKREILNAKKNGFIGKGKKSDNARKNAKKKKDLKSKKK